MSTPEIRIAARMRSARERLDISQEEVGRRLGVTLRTYARWERGESYGYLTRLGEIAKALETDESELLGGENITTAQPTIDELNKKLTMILEELHEMRETWTPPKRRRS